MRVMTMLMTAAVCLPGCSRGKDGPHDVGAEHTSGRTSTERASFLVAGSTKEERVVVTGLAVKYKFHAGNFFGAEKFADLGPCTGLGTQRAACEGRVQLATNGDEFIEFSNAPGPGKMDCRGEANYSDAHFVVGSTSTSNIS